MGFCKVLIAILEAMRRKCMIIVGFGVRATI